jgi:hypothetical protein
MTTYFRTKVQKDIGTTPVNVLATGATSRFTIIGCNLANTTDYDISVSVSVTDSQSVTGKYINSMQIPPYTSLKVITNGEKLILMENTRLTITSDTDTSIDAVISYAEIV